MVREGAVDGLWMAGDSFARPATALAGRGYPQQSRSSPRTMTRGSRPAKETPRHNNRRGEATMSLITTEKRGHVAILTINRPDSMNALGAPGDGDQVVEVCAAIKDRKSTR